MTVLIRANNVRGYVQAEEHDCIWLTFTEGRHTPIIQQKGISGTVTARPGELGVLVREV